MTKYSVWEFQSEKTLEKENRKVKFHFNILLNKSQKNYSPHLSIVNELKLYYTKHPIFLQCEQKWCCNVQHLLEPPCLWWWKRLQNFNIFWVFLTLPSSLPASFCCFLALHWNSATTLTTLTSLTPTSKLSPTCWSSWDQSCLWFLQFLSLDSELIPSGLTSSFPSLWPLCPWRC